MTAPRAPVRHVAVIGAGWAGLAAAVRAVQAGHAVTLLEMAARPGGRARSVPERQGPPLDNGQHILIGAYTRTLELMRTVGVSEQAVLQRCALTLRLPDGRGLAMPGGPAVPGFVWSVLHCRGWTWGARLALLRAAAGWALAGFDCDATWTVERLTRTLPGAVRELLIDPLCVAALNTAAHEASAQVLLRVLRDALFSAPGSADLLLPRRPLGELLPEAAVQWLDARGAHVVPGRQVRTLQQTPSGWQVDGEHFEAVILACSAAQASRLAAGVAPDWARVAGALTYEPIVTVYLHCPGARLPYPMTALPAGPAAPAQFAFDHGALGATPGLFAFVVSGARPWVERGLEATAAAVVDQAVAAFAKGTWPATPVVHRVLADKRATFRCTPGLHRPDTAVAPGLWAAGDYVEGPYPATLEGAVRSGERAAAALGETARPEAPRTPRQPPRAAGAPSGERPADSRRFRKSAYNFAMQNDASASRNQVA